MKSFRLFYLQLSDPRRKVFKKEVMARTGWSNSTFYYKSTHDNVTILELAVIRDIVARFKRENRSQERFIEQYYTHHPRY